MRHPIRSVHGWTVGMIVIPLLLIVGCRSDGHSGADKCPTFRREPFHVRRAHTRANGNMHKSIGQIKKTT